MDFAVPDPAAVGPGDPALRALRGPDPLFEIPAAPHLLRRVRGLVLQVGVPGGLAPIANALPSSSVGGMLGCGLCILAVPGSAGNEPVFLNGVLPSKYEAVIVRMHAEPYIALDPNANYDSPEHLAFCVRRLVAAIQGTPDPAYMLLAVDLFPCEVPPAALAGWVAEFYMPPTPLVFSQLATGPNDFMPDFSFLEYVFFGKVIAAQRDALGSPIRRALDVVQTQARRNFLLGANIFLSPATLLHWLSRTAFPESLQMLREVGAGTGRREQGVRDRHDYTFGTQEQRFHLTVDWLLAEPLTTRLANCTSVMRANPSVADARSALLRLVRCTTGSASAVAADIGAVVQLNEAIKNAVHCLLAPVFSTPTSTISDRVTAVERAYRLQVRSSSGVGVIGPTGVGSASGGGITASASKNDLYADEIAAALGTAAWHAMEAQLLAELAQPEPNSLRIHDILMASGVRGVRRLALRFRDWTNLPLVANSKPLAKALETLRDFRFVASHTLICDLTTYTVADPKLLTFRLEGRVAEAIRRGAFDEFSLVKDILRPVMIASAPNDDHLEYGDGLFHPSVPVLLSPLISRLERLLSLPSMPPPPPPFPPPPPPRLPPPPFTSIAQIVATVASEKIDLDGRPSPFNDDFFMQLHDYEIRALAEVSEVFCKFYVTAGDPTGPLLASVLPAVSGARGVLSEMRATRAHKRLESNNNPGMSKLFTDYREGRLGGFYASSSSGRFSRSPSAERRLLSDHDDRRQGDDHPRPSRRPLNGSSGSDERRSAPVIPGSKYEDTVRQSADGERFWFVGQNGDRASPVYDYPTLEVLAGKSRSELDFPYLLTTRPPGRRMEVCNFSHLPNHRNERASAHILPYRDFIHDVDEHFREPVGSSPDAIGSATQGARLQQHDDQRAQSRRQRGRSPHPLDSARSHGLHPGQRRDRLAPGNGDVDSA